jgi:hypothetical protein
MSEAVKTLFEKFIQMSSPAGRVRNDLCYRLRPQIQVIASVHGAEVPKKAHPLDDSGQVYVALRRLNLNKRLDPLQAVYLTYSPTFVSDQEAFDRLRMIRAAIAWTHSDMEILVHMLQQCAAGGAEKGKLVLALSEFCRNLLREPALDDPNRGIILSLSNLLRALYRNEVFRFAKCLQKGKLKKAEKDGLEGIGKNLATLFATAGFRDARSALAAPNLEEQELPIKTIGEVDLNSDHPNVRKLVARMEKSLTDKDFAAVLHSSASIFETLAKDVMENPNVDSQTLASFFDGYRRQSLLPEPVLDYMLRVYKERNVMPLAAHGSLAEPNITAGEAVTLCELTKSIVRIERKLAEQKSAKA